MPSSDPEAAALPAGVLATVGDSRISVHSAESALSSGKVSPQATLQELIELRALAHFAEHGGLDGARLRATRRAVLARALLERIEAAARLPETPSDAEVSVVTARRWIDVDRPEAREVCHAVVHGEQLDDASGQALAQRLADTLRSHHNCKDFVSAAQAFPVAGAKITSEPLMPVTSDGRTLILNTAGVPVDEGTPLDKEFARAVFQIKSVGDQSGVIRTSFGWHIILYASKVEAKHVPFEERRRIFLADILLERARTESDRVIAERKRECPIVIDRAAIETIGRAQVRP